jgi:hypothetical protein
MYTQLYMLIIHEKIHSFLYNNRVHQVSILLSSGRDIIVPVWPKTNVMVQYSFFLHTLCKFLRKNVAHNSSIVNLFPLVVQELPTLPEHLSALPVFSGVRVNHFMCLFCRSFFVLFLLYIVLSVLRFTDFDYPFGIFKLSFHVTLFVMDFLFLVSFLVS